jgi:hypothetical protein
MSRVGRRDRARIGNDLRVDVVGQVKADRELPGAGPSEVVAGDRRHARGVRVALGHGVDGLLASGARVDLDEMRLLDDVSAFPPYYSGRMLAVQGAGRRGAIDRPVCIGYRVPVQQQSLIACVTRSRKGVLEHSNANKLSRECRLYSRQNG